MSTKTYGRQMLKNLVMEARSIGIEVSFHKDMDENYIIVHKIVSSAPADMSAIRDEEHRPPSAATACWMLKGMIASARSQLCGILALQNNQL